MATSRDRPRGLAVRRSRHGCIITRQGAATIEIVFEVLFQLVAEASFGLLSEFVAELGIARTFRRRLDAFKVTASPLAVVGATALGAALAAGATWAFPVRLLPGIPLTGISLVVSPAVAAFVMTRWGRWRRARGGVTSVLTTPAGAAGFALGFAIVRVFWLHWLELAAASWSNGTL